METLTPKKALVMLFAWIAILAVGCLLHSCRTVHKTASSSSVTSTLIKDTARVVKEVSANSDLRLAGVRIRLNYKPQDSTVAAPVIAPTKTGNALVDAVGAAITASGQSGRLSSVDIDIDSLSSVSSSTAKTDSSAGHLVDSTAKKFNHSEASKRVTPIGVGLGLLLIALLAFIGYRLYKHFKILS